LKGSAGRSSA